MNEHWVAVVKTVCETAGFVACFYFIFRAYKEK